MRRSENTLKGEITGTAAGNAVVSELADLEDEFQSTPHETTKGRLFLRAYWATEQLREPPEHRTQEEEIRYLLSCLRGEAEYDEERANAFYEKKRRS